MFALFKDGIRISRWHKHRIVAIIEAYEAMCIWDCGVDFVGDTPFTFMDSAYEIRSIKDVHSIQQR